MLHVVMISPLPPQETGESPYTARLIKELVNKADLKITAIAGEEADTLDKTNARIESKSIWDGRNLFYPLTLLKEIAEIRPHLVHVQFGPHGKIYGGLFGEPMLLLLLLLRAVGIDTTITLHSTWMPRQVEERVEKYGFLSHLRFLARPAFKLYMKLLNWGTTSIQLSTSTMNSELRKQFLHHYEIEPTKVLEIPHPCRADVEIHDKREAAESLGLQDREIVLIFGFIREGKGIELAIRSMDRLRDLRPDALLLVAGRPKDKEGKKYLQKLRELTDERGLENHVQFDMRFIPEKELPLYFSAASVVLVPYTESVGASGPIHNYAAYGTPIVAADVGHHMKGSLGGSVVLFEAEDTEALADAVNRILSNKGFANQIGKKHRNYAKRESWPKAALRTLRHYAKTLKTE
ncbi:MAG: glycosyltransferase [Candidatus Lokiarchaeota archaeon]|nr:glycosyltransferase [Candidatus Lokiarchaeota archaeon]